MNVGDWVFTAHNENKITGFVVGRTDHKIVIQVTIPKNYGIIQMDVAEVFQHNKPVIWMDDLPTLIDLSLQVRDEAWFLKWTHELSLWRPVEDIFQNQAP